MTNHPLFDTEFYLSSLAGAAVSAPLRHFRREGDAEGRDPSPYFSTTFYKTRYPDWADQGAPTAMDDYLRRLTRGEERQPHPLFVPDEYRALNPDLAGLADPLLLHFIRHGDREGRAPSHGFDPVFYARAYLPLETGQAFRHYVTHGAQAGFLPRPEPKDAAQSAEAMRAALPDGRVVVMVAHDARKAGAPILLRNLSLALRERGWSPVFLLDQAGPLLPEFRALGPCFIIAEGWDVPGLAQGIPPEVTVLLNSVETARFAPDLLSGDRVGALLVHEMAAHVEARDLGAALRGAEAAGARIVASFPAVADGLAPMLNAPTTIIRPGIAVQPAGLAARRAVRDRIGGGPVFLGAGHADHRKGFDLFLDAARAIQAQCLEARFVWLGALTGWAQELAAAAPDLDLILPGFVEDAPAWYAQADVYLLTSRQDPGPATVLDAAFCGTPFVGYRSDLGILDLAKPAGTFITPGDQDAYVRAALETLEAWPPARRRMLRKMAAEQGGFAPYVDQIEALLT
ncbi:MAG: glycosyl transferase [Rhodobacterales bacterium]|nr:MAG: glycosyl transferase [Rhodobacterales bacterium]